MSAWTRRARFSIALALAATCAAAALTGCATGGAAGSAAAVSVTRVAAAPRVNVLTAPTIIAHTAAGPVGYRVVGEGTPLLLIMGWGGSMDGWAPSFVDALAAQHRVVVFDNSGVGQTAVAGSPLTITVMADQTSALISALQLGRPAVLGWSMGGLIAQALAVRHPAQVSRLILTATQPGTGQARLASPAALAALASTDPATLLSVLFPRGQGTAARAYLRGILEYPGFYEASAAVKESQDSAITQWMAGQDPAGRQVRRLRVPTLVADGTRDRLDPTVNDLMLARDIPGARLLLYPDAGHAFLFQDAAAFIPSVERFLRAFTTSPAR